MVKKDFDLTDDQLRHFKELQIIELNGEVDSFQV